MRDEAREPEEHGYGLDSQDGVRMRGAGKVSGRKGKERDDEERGPDSVEDEEVDAVGRGVDSVTVPP